MDERLAGLGQSILLAARMATAAHFSEQLIGTMRRQESAGGAEPNLSTDGELPIGRDRVPRSPFAERRAG